MFVPGDASFCTQAGISVDSYRIKGGAETASAHTHGKTDILVTAAPAMTSLTTTCVPNSDMRASWRLLLRFASDCFDNTTSRKGSSQPQCVKTRLNVGSPPAVIPGVVWLPFSTVPPGTGLLKSFILLARSAL